MKTILMVISIFLLLLLPYVVAGLVSQETLKDIDGNTYKVVKIGKQVWMAENLKVTKDRDGNAIKSYCFDDDEGNCEKLGRLYTWDVALKVSPDGWHLPSNEEWKTLIDHLGGESEAGKKLLEGGSSGFDALLAGAADFRGKYLYLGEYAIFWASTEANPERAYHQGFRKDGLCDLFAAMKGARISIRLIKDN
jgi:uncharacterized protein (TIGR02145 family)